jgi:hypothetical protein
MKRQLKLTARSPLMPSFRRPWERSRTGTDAPLGRLGKKFMRELERDYRNHGDEAIARLRKNEPRNYFKLLLSFAAVQPDS